MLLSAPLQLPLPPSANLLPPLLPLGGREGEATLPSVALRFTGLLRGVIGGAATTGVAGKRDRQSRFVMHESGDLVLKANNYEVTASSYVFEGGGGVPKKGAVAKVSSKRQVRSGPGGEHRLLLFPRCAGVCE